MSAETLDWLNKYTLIGFTEQRGNAWHYREGTDNHYAGAIPMDDVLKRLFNFTVEDAPLWVEYNGKKIPVEDRKAMVCSDNGDVLGIFKQGYQGHQYKEWLLDTVATILDDTLQIGSAGLLRNRGQAFVTVEVPESITTPEGVEFRPHLLACTSFDGTLATTYKRCIGVVVCDNTMSAALSEEGQQYKLRHSKYSGMKLTNAREALALVHTMSEDFAAEVAALTSWEVSDKQWAKLLDTMAPQPDEDASARSITVAEKKRDELETLYVRDERCAPWHGTAFGVLQVFNTYQHHFAQVRKGAPRFVRNMENVVSDKYANSDAIVLDALRKITKHDPVIRVAVPA